MKTGKFQPPDPESFIARHEETGAELFAELAPVPLYVNARIIAPKLGIGRRKSFRAGWLIGPQRLARGRDVMLLPAELKAWIAEQLAYVYPDHETASGLTPEEIKELEAEQDAKRKQYRKK